MKLSELRRQAGLSQAQLAAKLGVSPGAVGNWETGIRIPRLPTLRKMAEALGVTVGEIEFPAENEQAAASELTA
jgi:transcriptional regulator with XRE-family HTH domain